MSYTIYNGDCLDVLRGMESESVDALVTDPPAGISFMGAKWDSNKGSRNAWIAWLTEVMEEVLRVMKPGAHGLVWALPRTSHWTAMALEDAGFEVRDRISHIHGQGFPKSANVSKMIDKMGAANISWFGPWLRKERERRGITQKELAQHFPSKTGGLTGCVANWELGLNVPTVEQFNILCDVLGLPFDRLEEAEREVVGKSPHGFGPNSGSSLTHSMQAHPDITTDATDEAKRWSGWGTSLKPSTEDWWLIRKPLSESSVARQVLSNGCGAINVDGCRVRTTDGAILARDNKPGANGWKNSSGGPNNAALHGEPPGRWPSNLLLSHIGGPEGCRPTGEMKRVKGSFNNHVSTESIGSSGAAYSGGKPLQGYGYANPDGTEEVAEWRCVEGCPVRLMDEQSGQLRARGNVTPTIHADSSMFGNGHRSNDGKVNGGDKGGSSRFFKTFGAEYEQQEICHHNHTWACRCAGCIADSCFDYSDLPEHLRREVERKKREQTRQPDPDAEPGSIYKTFGGQDASENHLCPASRETEATREDCLAGDPCEDATERSKSTMFQQFHPDTHPGFQYVAKASRAERNKGLEDMPEKVPGFHANGQAGTRLGNQSERANGNNKPEIAPRANTHPTVKSLALCDYLVRLITPPGGTCLDPFAGSGSTGCSAVRQGFNFIGIEAESEYCEIARRRIAYWSTEATEEENGKAESPECLAQEALPLEMG